MTITINNTLAHGLRKQNIRFEAQEVGERMQKVIAKTRKGCQRSTPFFRRLVKNARHYLKPFIFADQIYKDGKKRKYIATIWMPLKDGSIAAFWLEANAPKFDIEMYNLFRVSKHALERLIERLQQPDIKECMAETMPMVDFAVHHQLEALPDEILTKHGAFRIARCDQWTYVIKTFVTRK